MTQVTVPYRSPSGQLSPSQPTRRALLVGAAAAPALALPAIALAAPAAADGRLLALVDRFRAQEAEAVALYGLADETDDPATDAMVVPAFDRADATAREIAACPAAGCRDLLAKARLAGEFLGDGGHGGLLFRGLLADLERLAGGRAMRDPTWAEIARQTVEGRLD